MVKSDMAVSPASPGAPAKGMAHYTALLPGLALCFAIAQGAIWIKNQTGIAALNPVVVALLVGMGLRLVIGMPASVKPGAAYAVRPVLRASIVLLGLQVTVAQLLSIGGGALALGMWVQRGTRNEGSSVKAPMPWFAFGFLAMVGVASTGVLPKAGIDFSRLLVPLMMSAAVAALGLSTDLKALHARGIRPLLLGVGATVFISLLGLVGARLF